MFGGQGASTFLAGAWMEGRQRKCIGKIWEGEKRGFWFPWIDAGKTLISRALNSAAGDCRGTEEDVGDITLAGAAGVCASEALSNSIK